MSKEKKLHLVETCSFARSTYKNVTEDKSFLKLKEAAQKIHNKGKKLSEATVIVNAKKTLAEGKIDEVVQKRVLKALQEAGADLDKVELWQFPISKINTKQSPNLNGRVYNRPLWENVIQKQTDVWKGGTGLANHPGDDEDGDFMNQSIVWLDGFLGDDDIVYGIGTFVGEGGALARQIISVGGRVGFSTSGYGDFLSDGITVDPESYEIDRLADLVLNPSQGVYGDYTDAYNTKKAESVVKNSDKKLKESKKMTKKHLYEDEQIKAISAAIKAGDNKVGELSKVADEMGLEVSVNFKEGTEEAISAELSAKLVAKVVAEWTKDDCTVENIDDIKACIKDAADQTGDSEEELKELFKEAFTEAEVDEEIIESIFKEQQEESEEVELDEDEDSDEESGKDSDDEDSDDENDEDSEDSEDSEDDESDEDMSLEEQLIVEHYAKNLRVIDKKSNELWEEKIQDLENLTKKLNEANLSKAVKARLNKKSKKIVANIMKEARAAIQEGFRAKEICEDLGINSITKLNNIKERLEDYVSLEECLGKATKEANKYRNLYEAKLQFAQSEAEAAYESEESVKALKEEVAALKQELKQQQVSNLTTKRTGVAAKLENVNLEKDYASLKEKYDTLKLRNKTLNNKLLEVTQSFQEASKTIKAYKSRVANLNNQLNESKDSVRQLSKLLKEKKEENLTLRESRRRVAENNKKLDRDLFNMKEAERANIRKQRLAEANVRREKQAKIEEFYDSDRMFRASKDIDSFLTNAGVEDKTDFAGVKTAKEAENKLLFSNELLSDEADFARDSIDVPREDVKSLSDLFN